MEKRYSEKIVQGDGTDGWICEEYQGNEMVDRYMVYEDPTKVETLEQKAIRLSNELNDVINQLKNTTP